MPPTNLDLAELRRLVDATNALPRHQNLIAHWECNAALRNAAPALLDEIDRLRKVEEAAREFIDAYDIGHEEEHMFVNALRKALGGKDDA